MFTSANVKKVAVYCGIAIIVAIAGKPIFHGIGTFFHKVAEFMPTWG